MKVALLAGGTGGTKLAHGFAQVVVDGEVSVIANVGDDFELYGLHIAPDIDALLYTLGGLMDPQRGWGVRDDSYTARWMLDRYGEPTWFQVGDADLATHVVRTRHLRSGASLTDATAAMAAALGITVRILPATDEPLRTRIQTDAGTLDFQDYFVRLRQEPEVRGVAFEGVDSARPTGAVLEAIAQADLLVLGPSNPIVSVGPILAMGDLRQALGAAACTRIAVSPIVAGKALKGPADRMMTSLGHEATAVGVARMYVGLVDRFVLDEADADLAAEVESLGLRAHVLPTVMHTQTDRASLARGILDLPRDMLPR